MEMAGLKKRVTIKLKTPNPLFMQWLTEWRDDAIEKDSKMQYCFSTALSSLKKYPLPLETGRDCKILHGFGDKLCQMLDNKLSRHSASASSSDISSSGKKRKLSTPSKKAYVPTLRSGAYAILLTLYQKSLLPSYPGFMYKSDITTEGQHLCDKSFTKPDAGSFYTSWSSMKTLLDKNLVTKKGCPAKFSLTDEGVVLASQLSNGEEEDDDADGVFLEEEELINSPPNLYPRHNNGKVSGAKRLKKNQNAAVPRKVSNKNNQDDADGVFLEEEELMYSQSVLNPRHDNVKVNSAKRLKRNLDAAVPRIVSNKNNQDDGDGVFLEEEELMYSQPILNPQHDIEKVSVVPRKAPNKKNTKAKRSDDELENLDDAATVCDQFEVFSFAPFSFEIILLVDKQETGGSSKELSDDPALSILTRLNVNYEVRHLKVSDYAWICRQKASKNELILPYAVERKRMDDLGGSIRDGRFHEQKFRLKQSGIHNLIYLIESFGSNTHTGLPLSSLYQAATNTLIQDEFCVKFTDDIRGTMEYLATFTTLLNKIYKSKTLTSCAKDNLTQSTVKHDTISLMTFNEFNKGSSKSRHFKVQEMFIRQLLQLKGMSVEKALAITESYPAPLLLYRTYSNISATEGEKLLSNIEFGKLKKKVGLVISKTVYQLFTSENF